MDPNDNNNICESVQLELKTVKAELKQELIENVDITEQEIHITQNINVTIDNSSDSTVSGQKRKHFEDNSLNVQEDERISDTSNPSKSIVKRRRYSDLQNEDSLTNSDTVLPDPVPQEREDSRHFTLLVTNLSKEWTSQEIIDYIKEQCGILISTINDSRENTDANCQMKLKFNDKAQLNKVLLKLKRKEVEGKLLTQIVDAYDDSQSHAESETMVHIDERETSSVLTQVLESDENSFHLKREYLESLGIKLPLTNWVTVTNFRCDKTELKEVLELCGKVLVCSVATINTKYANVMYSHPLEAVQAISMLNGKKLYGMPLKLAMNNAVDIKTFLPKGLQDLGPGLGNFGKPLPDLADQYKNFLNGKRSTIDAHLFQEDWLNNLGVTLEDSSYVRPIYNSLNDDESVSEHSQESSPRASSVQTNQFGPIGQRPPRPRSTPINRPQIRSDPINPITNFNNQPVVVPRWSNNTIPVQMQGPRAPNPNMANQNCPPIPGVETNDRRTFQNGVRPGPMSGPIGPNIPMGPRPIGPMMAPSPRIPISANNRFPGPISPMLGQRPVGPGSMGPISHSGQIGPVGPVGQVGSVRPVGLIGQVGQVGQAGLVGQVAQVGQIGQVGQAGLIGQVGQVGQAGLIAGQVGQIGQVGQVGQMGRVGPIGQVGPMGQVGQVGQMGLIGQIGQVGPVGQVGQVGQVNQGFQMGPRPGPNGPMPGQNVAGHNIRPVMSSMSYMTQASNSACNVQIYKSNDPTRLQISNLPPTTNFVNLGQKLSELGHVVFLEFTTPGCAIVRFASPADAERCYQKITERYWDEIRSRPVDLL